MEQEFEVLQSENVTQKTQSEIEIDKYIGNSAGFISEEVKDALGKIVAQLEMCNYESIGGFLKNNVAFLALKRMVNKI